MVKMMNEKQRLREAGEVFYVTPQVLEALGYGE